MRSHSSCSSRAFFELRTFVETTLDSWVSELLSCARLSLCFETDTVWLRESIDENTKRNISEA